MVDQVVEEIQTTQRRMPHMLGMQTQRQMVPRPRSKLGQVREGSGELQGLRRIYGESKEVRGEALGGEA